MVDDVVGFVRLVTAIATSSVTENVSTTAQANLTRCFSNALPGSVAVCCLCAAKSEGAGSHSFLYAARGLLTTTIAVAGEWGRVEQAISIDHSLTNPSGADIRNVLGIVVQGVKIDNVVEDLRFFLDTRIHVDN